MSNVKISKELKEILEAKPKQKVVYFDKKGRHYFNTFILPSKSYEEPKEEWKRFGTGKYHSHRVIPGLNPEEVKEALAIGDADTLIVEEISREDVLSAKVEESSQLLENVKNATQEQRAELLAFLGLTPETIANLNKQSSSKSNDDDDDDDE